MRVVMVRGTQAASDSRLRKEWRALADAGHHVHVLDWRFTGEADLGDEPPASAVTSYPVKAARGSWRLLTALPGWWAWVHRELRRREWDVVHACDLDTLPPAVRAARATGRRVVHDVYDYYPDMLAGQVPAAVDRAMRAYYRRLLARVDALVIADAARAHQTAPFEPDAVVMNCPHDARPADDPWRPEAGRLRVFYGGGFAPDRGVGTLLDAAEGLDGVEVVLAGFGPQAEALRERCARLPNATFLGRIPYDRVLAESVRADALYAFYDPSNPNNRLASPNKLYEAMMVGRPLVTNEGTLAGRRVHDVGMGLTATYGDAAGVRDALRRLRDDPALGRRFGDAGRKAFEAEYNWGVMAARLRDLYARL